jgi:hypothetical protein
MRDKLSLQSSIWMSLFWPSSSLCCPTRSLISLYPVNSHQLSCKLLLVNWCRAQNNGRSTDNDRPKMLDRSLFYLTGHFDRPHFHAFQCDCWRLELKHETTMYRNKFLTVCFNVNVSVSMTAGQKQILTELKSRWLVSLTGDLSPDILPILWCLQQTG